MKRFWRNTWVVAMTVSVWPWVTPAQIGSEKAILKHLRDGEEFEIELDALLKHGEALFSAAWTIQEGGGRPGAKGTGAHCPILLRPCYFREILIGSPPPMRTPVSDVMPCLASAAVVMRLPMYSC